MSLIFLIITYVASVVVAFGFLNANLRHVQSEFTATNTEKLRREWQRFSLVLSVIPVAGLLAAAIGFGFVEQTGWTLELGPVEGERKP